METWYRQYKSKAVKRIQFNDYDVLYTKKEENEDFQPRNEKLPKNVDKETVKITKAGQKIKIRKKDKLALITAIKDDDMDRADEILKRLKTDS